MSGSPLFDSPAILKYLGLSANYVPSPRDAPLEFLTKHLQQLPPEYLSPFSQLLTPRQRTSVLGIRNRRAVYAMSSTGRQKFGWVEARKQDPIAYESYMIAATGISGMPLAGDETEPTREFRKGEEEAIDERNWAEENFLGGAAMYQRHAPQSLLGQFEEEREAERIRSLRREARKQMDLEEQEEEESDDDDPGEQVKESPEEARAAFERVVRERFVDGLLEWGEYELVDYDDQWDPDSRDDEEKWFDEDEEDE
ncbi:hypothetical protein FRB99_008719 [Tulasnella sp. 403]|nr:hypothetical protein FRB99_008719 [Tulasnella sp. 403]